MKKPSPKIDVIARGHVSKKRYLYLIRKYGSGILNPPEPIIIIS